MRGRLILIVILSVLAFGFAALNWSEVVQTAPLSFGIFITEASAGLVLLTLLAVTLICFLVASATQETRHLIDYGQNQRALQAQRDLADKAETSRYVELKKQLEQHLRDNKERDAVATTELQRSMLVSQQEVRSQVETLSQVLLARLREIEMRLDERLEHMSSVSEFQAGEAEIARSRVKL
ncbi:hypothetical protein [Caenimonas koreensis]|uniref:hypothetical protein n=1 Tax=Caenimonas koreensis TaxID=367474 RepID=UPI003783B209